MIVIAEKLPHKIEYHLPSNFTAQLLYECYLNESSLASPASLSLFKQRWKKKFSSVKISGEKKMGSCDVCNTYKNEHAPKNTGISKTLSPSEKIAYNNHLNNQAAERQAYQKRRENASSMPRYYSSIIIDAMDAKRLPHQVPINKSTALCKKFKLNITGCMEHRKTHAHTSFYITLDHW